jgi:UDP-N-acetylmuramyl pentapeptide phosphotransferase/UDP-N-acetylglucosamine-1-phosphate transferase
MLLSEIQEVYLPWGVWIPVMVIAAGIINAYNFMDGINGITAAYSIAVLTGLWIVNNYQIEFIGNDFIYYVLISILVFSIYNFRTKAKCFAGDVGSISMAYIVVFLLAKLIIESGNWLYILFLSIYGTDTFSTIIHRLIHRENIFVAHRRHLYQLLVNELHISHLRVAALYALGQLSIFLSIVVVSGINIQSIGSFMIVTVIIGIVTFIYYLVRIQIGKRIKILLPRG